MGAFFPLDTNSRKFGIKNLFNCQSKFVVYLIICTCKLIYIGNTICLLAKRIGEHWSNIRRKKVGEKRESAYFYENCNSVHGGILRILSSHLEKRR
ncbi:hypothetical protein XELAEV_18042004mg [Xenopus laevis]|uniref:GIY-YIG domain-containing protein n=1 Tax=Xenopus laevis TaxID=8355 RepID=A0A974H644_XENLA|nr:hypothetical protein XELAEV_18042004mg [Xenopus laevis]